MPAPAPADPADARAETATPAPSPDFYQTLLTSGLWVLDDDAPYIPERVLQVIWNEGRLRTPLRGSEGQRIHIIHPGIWNVGGGPDFRDASLMIDGIAIRGDVEIHLDPGGWRAHGHHRQASYDGVILHVVWENPRQLEREPAHIPLCVVADQLSDPLERIIHDVDVYRYPYARMVGPSRAASAFAEMNDSQAAAVFRAWGLARLLAKTAALRAAWDSQTLDQAVYAALLDAMGYRANREPCRRLAARLPVATLRGHDERGIQALLLGAAGLLPDPSRDPVHPDYRPWLDSLWDRWWALRPDLPADLPTDTPAPDIPWTRGGLRPANTPERRLIAAAHILHRLQARPGAAIRDACRAPGAPRTVLRRLRACLHTSAIDPDYAHFIGFAKPASRPARLLGDARTRDILANICAPLAMADAMRRGHLGDCRRARALMLALPQLQENRRFQEAAHLFFVPPSRARDIVTDACGQLGLLQALDDFIASPAPQPDPAPN